jgi:regulator of replication initiation timing
MAEDEAIKPDESAAADEKDQAEELWKPAITEVETRVSDLSTQLRESNKRVSDQGETLQTLAADNQKLRERVEELSNRVPSPSPEPPPNPSTKQKSEDDPPPKKEEKPPPAPAKPKRRPL